MIHMMIATIVITFLAPASAGPLWRGPGRLKHSIAALLSLSDAAAAAASLLLPVLESYFSPD